MTHYDVGVDIELRGRKRYTLRVVTSRGRNHASGAFLGSELYHFVVRATQLERVDRLQVFAFERHLLIESLGDTAGTLQWRFNRDIVDS